MRKLLLLLPSTTLSHFFFFFVSMFIAHRSEGYGRHYSTTTHPLASSACPSSTPPTASSPALVEQAWPKVTILHNGIGHLCGYIKWWKVFRTNGQLMHLPVTPSVPPPR
ncbi:hypothetical protein GYMLUDRAFT_392676 [Collybiopsis luxurians FD-317 M1]|uniref:Uncharacterized protein n=1 Tax=Collybiopsis luxurians FD-317 M1 TaxID=944289 RepID=A0A0D0AMX8_9AGAR|nr:hypothetical protein GYMLUDRAFT_392676 [Collybiopsis luxurians FD-317 M1]